MDYNIDIQDNKTYIYVMSYYSPSNDLIITHLMNTDISIFEINEWDDLLNKNLFFTPLHILNADFLNYKYFFMLEDFL